MRAAANKYRAKAFECLSLAECMNDPERRAEILRDARWCWGSVDGRLGLTVDLSKRTGPKKLYETNTTDRYLAWWAEPVGRLR